MKELKFNIQYLLNRKELYFAIIGIMVVNLVHVFLVVQQYTQWAPSGYFKTGEYLSILYNADITLNSTIIIAFPILLGMILSDSSWIEKKNNTAHLLYVRLNLRNNIFVRWVLSIIITFMIAFIGFVLNYMALRLIFGSGNLDIHFQSVSYNLEVLPEYFLDTIRNSNPTIFILLISAHTSLLLGLLSGVSYGLSFFTRQRLVIYFQVVLFIIILEVILSFLGLNAFSVVKQLQPFSIFSLFNAIGLYTILLLINAGLFLLQYKKKELLL